MKEKGAKLPGTLSPASFWKIYPSSLLELNKIYTYCGSDSYYYPIFQTQLLHTKDV